jgi:hypothetical protein
MEGAVRVSEGKRDVHQNADRSDRNGENRPRGNLIADRGADRRDLQLGERSYVVGQRL